MSELTDGELLAELGVEIRAPKKRKYTEVDERIIAGFEDIASFFEERGHLPRHGEQFDIFERLYAIRLDRLRAMPEAVSLLTPLDTHGLLTQSEPASPEGIGLDDSSLLAELGINLEAPSNIAVLRHVVSAEERRAAEEIADRTKCKDFEAFEPLLDQAAAELRSGIRTAHRFSGDINIAKGEFFIVGGQLAYVAEKGQEFRITAGVDARLRVIYSNGTESSLLLRSLQRALYKDETGRRLSTPVHTEPKLFGTEWEEDDVSTGTIYVLRSKSTNPFIAKNHDLIHKIGVTGGSVAARIANAKQDATFLLADVEVAATYKMAGIKRTKLETLLHNLFKPAQLDIKITDLLGNPIKPKEWFLVPLHVIDEAVSRIQDGSIEGAYYSPEQAKIIIESDDSSSDEV